MPKRKSTDHDESKSTDVLAGGFKSFVSRNPPWAYLQLELVTHPLTTTNTPLDLLTARTYLTSALSQLLGLTGTAIPIDILKLEPAQPQRNAISQGDTLWIRIPHDDATAVIAALSSWIGGSGGSGDGAGSVAWRVKYKGGWLTSLARGHGDDMFVP
ncbi:hypothetical protein VTO42DRAFT_7520 [Malbranchea cinnamomea]